MAKRVLFVMVVIVLAACTQGLEKTPQELELEQQFVVNEFCSDNPDPINPCTPCSDGIDNDGDGRIDWGYTMTNDANCSSPFDTSEAAGEDQQKIHWQQFPEFHVHPKFKIVYQGLSTGEAGLIHLRRGFTHTTAYMLEEEFVPLIPRENRAILWTGVSGPENEDYLWRNHHIPWGFEIEDRHIDYWQGYMNNYANRHDDSRGSGVPNVDLLVADIEAKYRIDENILALKSESFIPAGLQSLSDELFLEAYKRDMASLYQETVAWPRSIGFDGLMGSYSDVAIERNYNIVDDHSWQDWQSDFSLVNYLFYDYEDPSSDWRQNFGPFRDTIDVANPTVYLFNQYPATPEEDPNQWTRAGRYLSYMLFFFDINRHWMGDKPIIPFQWLLMHNSTSYTGNDRVVPGQMAHAIAIFPFFADIQGQWVWDNRFESPDLPSRHSAYEHYIHGLYRVSQFNEMFEGDYEIVIPENPRDQYANKSPIWRGIVNNGKILIAAHNPFAQTHHVTTFDIRYQGEFVTTLAVDGQSTFLGTFDLP